MVPDSEILRIIRVTWKVDDPQKLATAHGMEILRLTLLELANVDPTNARNPSGLFVARLHQVVARKSEVASGHGPIDADPIPITESDPDIDLGELWTLAVKKLPILPSAKVSKFYPIDDFPAAFTLIAFSRDGIAVVEIDHPFNYPVFERLSGHVARALEDAAADIKGKKYPNGVEIRSVVARLSNGV